MPLGRVMIGRSCVPGFGIFEEGPVKPMRRSRRDARGRVTQPPRAPFKKNSAFSTKPRTFTIRSTDNHQSADSSATTVRWT
jgi:hypothetical protein